MGQDMIQQEDFFIESADRTSISGVHVHRFKLYDIMHRYEQRYLSHVATIMRHDQDEKWTVVMQWGMVSFIANDIEDGLEKARLYIQMIKNSGNESKAVTLMAHIQTFETAKSVMLSERQEKMREDILNGNDND